MNISVSADIRAITRDLRLLHDEVVPKAVVSSLNKTNRKMRTATVRAIARMLGVKPQRRIRRRILLPRGARATRRRWEAGGLTLFETLPAHYLPDAFSRNLRSGNRQAGASAPFSAQDRIYRRKTAARLPIALQYTDVTTRAYVARDNALHRVSRQYPRLFTRELISRIRKRRGGGDAR